MRKRREWYEGARYHLMGRGTRRSAIFREEEDYAIFMMILVKAMEKYPFDLHAYCLMTNHFHLEITTYTDPIWMIMRMLMHHYAMTFNRKYGIGGHLFDSRYTSCLIADDIYFLEVSRYIHLNPVRAQMVREPQGYRYSSYSRYVADDVSAMGSFFASGPLETDAVLKMFQGCSCEQYRMFVEGKISHAEQEALIMKDMGENELWLPG